MSKGAVIPAHTITETAGGGIAEILVNGVSAVCDPQGTLYLPSSGMLVVSDLHLEKGAAFARRGMMLPPYDTTATLDILSAVITRYKPKTVVSLGDSFHDREGSRHLPEDSRQRIGDMARGRDWIWINGNHDPEGPADLPGTSTDELVHGGLVFRHEPRPGLGENGARGEIAGHLHPSATVRRRGKSVRRACFACDGHRLVMPALGVLSGGLDLRHRALQGIFRPETLVAHILGSERIYSVRFDRLAG